MDVGDSKQPDDRETGASNFDALTSALANRYRIVRLLGAGGMATVYLAEDLKHHRQVAIKVLRPEITAVVGTSRFLREIDIAANLAHPHILPLHDSGEAAGFLYYVMPYVQGESLRSRLTLEKQLPLAEALRLTRQLADALGHAHRLGIVHRDLKPENVLLEAGHAVLTDFGIAMAVTAAGGERLTNTGIVVGTPAYMSPEQAVGDSRVDARSDVYALGCMLYEMLAGEPPFTGPNAQAVIARKSLGVPPPLSVIRENVPDRVQRAIDRAMARIPADRFASTAEFVTALGGDSTTETVYLRKAPRKRLVWAAGAASILLAALLVWRMLPARTRAPSTAWSLAVLYFDNLSSDSADAYLADGLTEEISSRLARIDRLQVKSRHSVRQYRGRNLVISPRWAERSGSPTLLKEALGARASASARRCIWLMRGQAFSCGQTTTTRPQGTSSRCRPMSRTKSRFRSQGVCCQPKPPCSPPSLRTIPRPMTGSCAATTTWRSEVPAR